MEYVDKDPEEASEPSVLSQNQEAKSGVSILEAEDPTVEFNEELKERKSQSQEKVGESEKLITPQSIIKLQRDSTTLVTNVQTAADAKESMRRTELEEARRLRLERLENDRQSSQEKYEAITRGWSLAKQKVIPQELQEALNSQQQLCATLIEDKKKLINDLQQELKAGDDRYVRDLRRQAEELDLMMERMEDQIQTLTKAYREELAQIERVYQQESEVLLTRDKTEWDQCMKKLLDEELERLTQRRKKVEEYEAKIHSLMLDTTDKCSVIDNEHCAKFQTQERNHQKIQATRMITEQKQKQQEVEAKIHDSKLAHMKSRISSLEKDMKNLRAQCTSQKKEFTKKSGYLSEDYKCKTQQFERIQQKIKHFAVADVRKFKEMWLMMEEEVKQLVERALLIDLLICKQHLGLTWERPPMVFTELCGPIQPQKQGWGPTSKKSIECSEGMTDASVGPGIESDAKCAQVVTHKEGTGMQSESGAEEEEGKLLRETLKKTMELLCDEAGYLMEDKLLNMLAPLEKTEQTIVKLGSLLSFFGIEDEDLPKLANFLLKYNHQQRQQTEDICFESGGFSDNTEEVETTLLTPEPIDPNHVVPALKSFLEQLKRSKESSAQRHPSFLHVEARDTSEDEAYWESMGNVISEDKLQLWDAAEKTLKRYHAVLTEISELIPETQSLEQQNEELRMLLQQSLNSIV